MDLKTIRQEKKIRAFEADLDRMGCQLYVRGTRAFADSLRATQLRTKAHDHLAICWDELGNTFILRADGTRTQMLSNEVKA